MKEFKFWAVIFPLRKLGLYLGALSIILILVAINLQSWHVFFYLCLAIICVIALIPLFIVRRVKLVLEEKHISIEYGLTKKSFPLEEFQYLRAAEEDHGKVRSEMNLIFRNRIYIFHILSAMLSKKTEQYLGVTKGIIAFYELKDRGKDRKNHSSLHIYWNPQSR